MNPLAADKHFFNALIAGDTQSLDRILVDDFILIDVMSGSEITKPAFLAAIGSGQVKFEAIEPAENRVRLYQTTAIITGRTQMKGRLGDAPFAASSRYTHVFVQTQGKRQMAHGIDARHCDCGDGKAELNAPILRAGHSAVCQSPWSVLFKGASPRAASLFRRS